MIYESKNYTYRIQFSGYIIIDKEINKGGKSCRYKLLQSNKREFDIFDDISEHVTLVQLMNMVENFNHEVSISGCYINYSD